MSANSVLLSIGSLERRCLLSPCNAYMIRRVKLRQAPHQFLVQSASNGSGERENVAMTITYTYVLSYADAHATTGCERRNDGA